MCELCRRLAADPVEELGPCARAAYDSTLRPFHGSMSSSVFSVVMRAAPYRETFEAALVEGTEVAAAAAGGGGGGAAEEGGGAAAGGVRPALGKEMGAFCGTFAPLLDRVQRFLAEEGLDDPTPV